MLGMSLVLMLIVSGIAVFTAYGGRMSAKNQGKMKATHKAQVEVERIVQEIEASDRVLSRYPPTGASPVATTNFSDTLILRQPLFDADGGAQPGMYRVVIFKLVPDDSEDGPFILKKYVASVVSDVPGNAVLNDIVLTRVRTLNMGFTSLQRVEGAIGQTTFPIVTTGYSAGLASCAPPLQVVANGTSLGSGGGVQISESQLTLSGALASASVIDVRLPVTPTESAPDGTTAIGSITFEVTPQSQWESSTLSKKREDLTVVTSANLRNR
jgi:hypothetical protein